LTDHRSIDSIDRKLRGVLNFDEILNFDNDRAISFSSDGKLLAFSIIQGADKNNVLLWNINLRKEEYIFKGHRLSPLGRIHSIAFSKVGNLLASASQDSTVKLWNTATGEQYASLENAEPVYSVSFSPKGSTLVSGSSKGSVEFWDVEGKCRLDILKSKALSSIKSLAFSSDGSTLAVGGDTVSDYVDAKYVEIWDINEKKIIHVLDGHSDLVYSVAFSPDGQLLASGSKDGNVKLWNVKSGKETLPLPEQSNGDSRAEITSVAFSSDGKLLASSHMDGVVKIWRS
jgi:WD40 repeat protein